MNVTLDRIETTLPDRIVPVRELGGALGLTKTKLSLFEKVHGLRTLRLDPDVPLWDMLTSCAERALSGVDPERVRFLVYAHAIHEVATPLANPPELLRDRLGLSRAEAFSITQQNCASALGAVVVAGDLLRAEGRPGDLALVLTGEKPFNRMIQVVPNTAIMGEAAAACVVGVDGPGDVVRSYVARTLGEYSDLITLSAEEVAQLGKIYAPVLAEVIAEAVAAAALTIDDIDLVLPHNVNMLAWRNVIAELGIAADRVFLDNIPRYSHCFASDVFVNYTSLRSANRLRPHAHYVLAAVGAGATFSAAVITHQETR